MKKILNALKSVVNFFRSGKATAALNSVASLVPKALPIVQIVALLTPTKADDEVLALFQKFGLPYVENYLALPQEQRGAALLKAASTKLAEQVPGTPTHILDAAVQLALVGYRA